MTEMCADSRRADALNAVTLVENVARLATQGLFGFAFAAFAEAGRAYLTFFCNAVSEAACSLFPFPCFSVADKANAGCCAAGRRLPWLA